MPLRLLPGELDWQATVWSREPWRPPATLSRVLRERLEVREQGSLSEAQALAAFHAAAGRRAVVEEDEFPGPRDRSPGRDFSW